MNEQGKVPEIANEQSIERATPSSPAQDRPRLVKWADGLACAALVCAFAGTGLLFVSLSAWHIEPLACSAMLLCPVSVILIAIAYCLLASTYGLKTGPWVAGFVIVSLFLAILVPALAKVRDGNKSILCRNRLHALAQAIEVYANSNDGYLPEPNLWCDLLVRFNRELDTKTFMSPEEEGVCRYGFNRNLKGTRLTELPEGTAIIFDSGGRWNCNGGPELIEFPHARQCHILLAGEHFPWPREFHAEELVKEPPRWQP